jgi:2,3-bisphosphoglycerate-independent phosphoglycerate mutase
MDDNNTKEGKYIAKALERFQLVSHDILEKHKINKKRQKKKLPKANFILTRGGGSLMDVVSFRDKYSLNGACVAGAPLYKGVAKYIGLEVIDVKGATGKLDTNVKSKVKAVEKALKRKDFVFLHFKGTDIAAEDYGDANIKKSFIERVDRELSPIRSIADIVIAVTGDHTTVCALKDHASDPVPILIYPGSHRSNVHQYFGERFASKGVLGKISGPDLMPLLIKKREE